MLASFMALLFVPMTLAMLAVAGWHKWRKGRLGGTGPALVGVLLLQAFLAYVAYNEHRYWEGVDLNPEITREDLIGKWQFQDETLTLRADGTFTYNNGPPGAWSMESHMSTTFRVGDEQWTAITRHGELLLIEITKAQDPDEWNLYRAFSRRR